MFSRQTRKAPIGHVGRNRCDVARPRAGGGARRPRLAGRGARSALGAFLAGAAAFFVPSFGANAQETLRVLAVGQSNMEGRYGPSVDRWQYPAIPEIRAWNYMKKSFGTAELGAVPFSLNQKGTRPANNIAYVFAQRVHDDLGRNVDITLLTESGRRIEYFLPEAVLQENGWESDRSAAPFGASLGEEIFAPDGDASLALPDGAVYDVVLVSQGAANFNRDVFPVETADEYAAKLRAFIGALYASELINTTSAILFANINPKYLYADIHREALKQVVDFQTGFIEWRGILDVEDYRQDGEFDRHATGWGMNDLADRYYLKFLELNEPAF